MKIEKAIRQKRFRVKPGFRIDLMLETSDARRCTLILEDASLTGISAIADNDPLVIGLEPGSIVPDAKLVWQDGEAGLGRIVVRRVMEKGGEFSVAFTTIDSKIALGGWLSRYFDELETGEQSAFDFELGSQKFNLAHFVESEFFHPDLFERCRQYKFLLKDLSSQGLFQYYSTKHSQSGSRVVCKTPRDKTAREYLNFASYDYLGYSVHEDVKKAAKNAIDAFGLSSNGSLVLGGKNSLHEILEQKIAERFGRDDALVFSNGYSTNVGAISAIAKPNDLIVADNYSHASLHDGFAASMAKTRLFRHNNNDHLKSILESNRSTHNGCLIVTEGFFSMEGTAPDLAGIVKIKEKYNSRLFLDECHSFGIVGPNGLGVAEREGILNSVDMYMATFSKSLGSGAGGFVTASKDVVEWLRYFARAGMFSAALPPAVAGAAIKVLDLLETGRDRREKLQHNIKRMRKGIKELGFESVGDPECPIIPVLVGSEDVLSKMNEVLTKRNIFVNCILYPAVPLGAARFRFSMTVHHSDSDIDLALRALEEALDKSKK